MRDTTLKSLFSKEVVNTVTGERLGYINDAEIDLEDGRITCLYTVKSCKPFSGKKIIRKFSYDDIAKIGDDIILIRSCVCVINRKSENAKKQL